MDAHHASPDLGRGVFDGGNGGDARVIDQAIESTECLVDFTHHVLPGRFIANVLSNEGGADVISVSLSRFGINVCHHHPSTFTSEYPGICKTQA